MRTSNIYQIQPLTRISTSSNLGPQIHTNTPQSKQKTPLHEFPHSTINGIDEILFWDSKLKETPKIILKNFSLSKLQNFS